MYCFFFIDYGAYLQFSISFSFSCFFWIWTVAAHTNVDVYISSTRILGLGVIVLVCMCVSVSMSMHCYPTIVVNNAMSSAMSWAYLYCIYNVCVCVLLYAITQLACYKQIWKTVYGKIYKPIFATISHTLPDVQQNSENNFANVAYYHEAMWFLPALPRLPLTPCMRMRMGCIV